MTRETRRARSPRSRGLVYSSSRKRTTRCRSPRHFELGDLGFPQGVGRLAPRLNFFLRRCPLPFAVFVAAVPAIRLGPLDDWQCSSELSTTQEWHLHPPTVDDPASIRFEGMVGILNFLFDTNRVKLKWGTSQFRLHITTLFVMDTSRMHPQCLVVSLPTDIPPK